uniref:Uncharacterized protein n=1 Tax=Gopherus evgoodei TaxID=1825980 RepID=A0A8C4YEK9_9SAUR
SPSGLALTLIVSWPQVLLLSLLMVSLLSAAFVTCPNEKVGKEIARAMVEKHLAACVNIMPQITSIGHEGCVWQGQSGESLGVLLGNPCLSVHPYEVAEVIALPIQQGNAPYLQWVGETVPE